MPRSYKEENWGDQVNSVWEAVKRGLERVKMKNLHCKKPLSVFKTTVCKLNAVRGRVGE
jgi:hypothetical protein